MQLFDNFAIIIRLTLGLQIRGVIRALGKYSVPAEVRALKRPDGTKVKNIGGHYYVYESSSKRVKVPGPDGSWISKVKTTSGKCIGRITLSDGFIPNDTRLADDEVTVFGYGDYALAMSGGNTLNELKKKFNAADANQIYVVAVITVVHGFTYMRDMSMVYNESFLKLRFPDVHVGEDALRTLYENLGKKRIRVDAFEQQLIDGSSKKVAFDGHVIACASELNDISAYGYKASKLNSEQINWMTAYDVKTGRPLASEFFNGSDPDKSVLSQFFDRFTFTGTLFVVDRGFNTEANKKLLSSDGNSYIMPMIQGRNDYKDVYESIKFDKRRSFVYDKDGYSSLVYYYDHRSSGNGGGIAFLDTTRQSAERHTYIKNMNAGKKKYTEDGLKASEKDFGLFILETSDAEKSPRELFSDYKSRWSIETFYNYVDNTMDFKSLYQEDYCRTEGLGFIIQVAGMIHCELTEITRKHKLQLKKAMRTLKGLRLSKEKNNWHIKNAVKEKRELAEKLSISLDPDIILSA